MRFTEYLTEMAKRASPEDFYKWCKAKYGAAACKSLTIPQMRDVATEHDVQIPGYVYKQKAGKGTWDATIHSDTKDVPPPKDVAKVEPKKTPAKSDDAKKADVKVPKEAPKKVEQVTSDANLEIPEIIWNSSWTEPREIYAEIKKKFGVDREDTYRVKDTKHKSSGYNQYVHLDRHYIVSKKDNKVLGTWEVTGGSKQLGRGLVVSGRGNLASDKPAKKAEVAKKEEPARKGGQASVAEMKAALLDVKAEMNKVRNNTWGGFEFRGPEEQPYGSKGWEISVRDWGHWEITPEQRSHMEDGEDEDYDWETFMDGEKLHKLLKGVEKQHPNVKLTFSAEEKNWLHIMAD